MDTKYRLTDESIMMGTHILYRIKALRSFSDVKKGDLGGFIESGYNLSHDDNCWIYDNALVFGRTLLFVGARISGSACISAHTYDYIYENIKIDHDIWTQVLKINGKKYLISNTLEKILVE